MEIKPLEIVGAFKIKPNKFEDNRGIFGRTFCFKEFEAFDLNTEWVQMNTSISNIKGTVRGIHYQKPPHSEIKLIRCVRGMVIDILVDLRKESTSFGSVCEVILDSKDMDMVYIPEGCGHGFQTLTHNVELNYCHSKFYEPNYESGINVQDPDLGINWPLPILNLSARDQNHPSFKKTEPLVL